MVEQKNFPYYLPEEPKNRNARASLMLTHEQVLMIPSALRLLDTLISTHNPFKRLFLNPHLSEKEAALIESIHNACINCALGQEAHFRSKDKSNEE